MTNNHDADIRADFEEFYWNNKYGEGIFAGAQNVRQRVFARNRDGIYFQDQLNRELDIYIAGIEQGKRIEKERMIGLAESILMIYAPYGLSDSQIKILAKSSVDDYVLSSNTSKD